MGFIVYILRLFLAILAVTIRAQGFSWDSIKYVYAFGDSYSFVQGTKGFANFSFIGDKLNLAFTPQDLLADEIIPRNTSSEGSNWLEFLTGCFEGSPLNCPRQLWDFAFAGSDIDGDLLPLHHDFTIPLVDQVSQWATYALDVIPHPENETLTTWWIGINDTGDSNRNTSISNFTAFWETEMQSYFKAVDLASEHGLKIHLFLNVPPEERAPGSLGNPGQLQEHIDLFNSVLADFISHFHSTHPDNTVMSFDAHTWFNNVLDNPTEFGFTDVTGFCTCADPSGYFWYNSGHPTQRVHQLLAEAVRDHLLSV
ncbi:hypothetical protein AN958_07752 [Leucoagaricus sp. SymC.cos]|nr:hypothetical protein AN958_07752 [Leucoagaricus sp. SymC.cos]